ncbi:MAG: Ig-like domain-containing protein, partial [Clostridia bacterium]
TQKSYTIDVNRARSSNADLGNLTISQGSLTPVFSSGTTAYSASVGNAVTSLNVIPTVADSTATVKVNGNSVTSGSASNVPLTVGSNTITVTVKAEDGTTQKPYTITVTRAASSNADLNSLTISQGSLTPAFSSATAAYTASVANTVTSLNVTPTVADSTATVKVNGNSVTSGSASSVPLTVGSNTITVTVTAQDGSTQKSYTIDVNRARSSNADLGNLTISQGSLTPVFSSATTGYTASVANTVTSLDVTPTVADSTATVNVNGNSVTSGNASNVSLTVGSNSITVTVTAQDGSTQQYTITVTRAASSNADLGNLTISQGSLSPAFSSATTDYTASVANAVTSLNVTPTVADSTATVKVNDNSVTSGSASNVPLTVGTNTITVTVTAENGTTRNTYTITVKRAANIPAYYPVENITLNQPELTLTASGDPASLAATITPSYATIQTMTWASSDPDVATVDEHGVVTPIAAGTATITVTTDDQAKTATSKVKVVDEEVRKLVGLKSSEKTILLKPNQSSSIKLYAIYSDGSKEEITKNSSVTYRTSTSKIATITKGKIRARNVEGKATLTATYQGETIDIPVVVSKVEVKKLEMNQKDLLLETDEEEQLKLEATLSNKKTDDVTELATWSSSEPAVATVDENGKVTALDTGTTVITATYGGETIELTVKVSKAKEIKRISINKRNVTVAVGKEQTVKLTATYKDNSNKNVTDKAKWSSEDESIATINDGVIIGKAKGTVKIQAKYQGKAVTITVTVK